MTEIVTRQQFIDWLKTKPADKPACLDDTYNCVLAEYAKEKFGGEEIEAGMFGVWDGGWEKPPLFTIDEFSFHHFDGAKTYGEVVKKLEG